MKSKAILLSLSILILSGTSSFAQSPDDDARMFVFGHSLIHHEIQLNPTPSQETSVPHWLHFLAEEAQKQYTISGQYGFLTTHINLPPIAQWGFDFAPSAWESDDEPFAQAHFSDVLITPANFIQWQGPAEDFFNENFSPIDATNTMIDWCAEQTPDINYYIYENWPDMAPYLNADFPPSNPEWLAYNDYTQNEFADWFDQYHQGVITNQQDKCVQLIPVGRLISKALQTSPFDQISVTQLYEDNAPHGRPTIYFMAAMITYMAIYEEITPASYQVSGFIEPTVADNYQALSQFFWDELSAFNDENGNSKVFCNTLSATTDSESNQRNIQIYPNPTTDAFHIKNLDEKIDLKLYDATGKNLLTQTLSSPDESINMTPFAPGIYFIKISTYNQDTNQYIKLIKS